MNDLCDKCNLPVDPKDDIVRMMVTGGLLNGINLIFFKPRHIRCSPSRAQYIFDDVIDYRPEFDKRLRCEEHTAKWTKTYRDAYNLHLNQFT